MAKELFLYDEIGGWGTSASDFIDQVNAAGEEPIDLRINSAGGSVFEGYAIYNALKRHAHGVTVYIDGLAASIASYIAMAGSKIYMAENAMMMIHRPYSMSGGGTAEEMRKQADILEKLESSLVDAYSSRTGIPADEIAKMLDEETWLDADQAITFGFADELAPALAMAAIFKSDDFKNFKNVPEKAKALIKNSMENKTEIVTDDKKGVVENPPAAPAPAPDPAAPVADKKRSIFARVADWMKDNAALVRDLAQANSTIEAKDIEIAEMKTKLDQGSVVIARLESEIKTFQDGVKSLEDAIKKLEDEKQSVAEKSQAEITRLGFPENKLPAAIDNESMDTPENLKARLDAIKDPAERIKFLRENKAAIANANTALKAAAKKAA